MSATINRKKGISKRRMRTLLTVAAQCLNEIRYAGGLNIRGIVESMIQNEQFMMVLGNPLAQFGPLKFPFLGATLLPEKNVPENAFVEESIRYRTVIANDGTRYSPVQKKGSMLVGSFQVILGNSDIGAEFTGQDYDAFIRLMERYQDGNLNGGEDQMSMEAVASLLQWVDLAINRPLLVKNEKQRWEAITFAQVVRTGDNNYKEIVNFPNPTGQRVNAAGAWSSNSYDPYPDIINMAEFMRQKGWTVGRIISSTPVTAKLTNNINIRQRVGRVSMISGTVTGLAGRASKAEIDDLLSKDDLPPIETYDITYATQNGFTWYLARNVFIMVATTGRDMRIDLGDAQPLVMQDTLGYVAVGRAAGQSAPGRASHFQAFENKPPRIEGEGWQTSLPVICEPEAIGVIQNIT